jgi:flagellar protein FlaG
MPAKPDTSAPATVPTREKVVSPALSSSGLADRETAVAALSEVTADIEEALTVLNQTLSVGPTHAAISKDNELNTFVIRIFDDKSGEMIREIPNEAMQRFARNLQQIQGLLFDIKL